MTCQMEACRAWCPGCSKEWRLACGRWVMRAHNRWYPATYAMVACEGSGQPQRLTGHPQAARDSPAQRAAGDDSVARPCEGAA
jgi:hypothetical protein